MERKERLQKALNYLRLNGYVSSQVDAANKMGASEATVSNALRGNERYLTDKFLARFNSTFEDIFNLDWLTREEGTMLADESTQQDNNLSDLYKEIERLKSIKLPTEKDKIADIWLRFMENQRQYNEIMKEMAELYKQIKGE